MSLTIGIALAGRHSGLVGRAQVWLVGVRMDLEAWHTGCGLGRLGKLVMEGCEFGLQVQQADWTLAWQAGAQA